MSAPIIISLVIVGLVALVAIAYVFQLMEKNRQEKVALEKALRSRARNFQHMLESFPESFLSKNLKLILCTCIRDVYEQLSNINPKEESYVRNMASVAQQMDEIKKLSNDQKHHVFDDMAQIKEAQRQLTSLSKFIAKLQQNGKISADDGGKARKEIRRLLVHTRLDIYASASAGAESKRKFRLAAHHVGMALELLDKENTDGFYNKDIKKLQERSVALNKMAEQEAEASQQNLTSDKEEWKEYDEKEKEEKEHWKKKNLYDDR